MALIEPRTAPGTLELLPREQRIFQHMLDVIRAGYERFGFVPIETPVFELKDILLTKSGGETEKQVYFVQSTGALEQGHAPDLALRFDLTVPLARYVAQHERDLAFPFRRYQIQRVYRGERPQRGREREFYQCDIDVIGKDKLDSAFDAELPAIIATIFDELGVGAFTIHFSNRKILRGILTAYGVDQAETQKLILREIDKLDKIGPAKVEESLRNLGLSPTQSTALLALVTFKGGKAETLAHLKAEKITDPLFMEGLQEVEQLIEGLKALGVAENHTALNLAIARGLDYYTGTVYETLLNDHPEFGSVCSGGRYENLASHYTRSKLPGVGLSIGLTRLFDQLYANKLLPEQPSSVAVLITQMDPALRTDYFTLAATLRRAGLNVENYLEPAKLEKQLKYADRGGIPFVILMGGDEKAKGTVLLKQLAKNIQTELKKEDLLDYLKNLITTGASPKP